MAGRPRVNADRDDKIFDLVQEGSSLREVSLRYGISRERVRQIHEKESKRRGIIKAAAISLVMLLMTACSAKIQTSPYVKLGDGQEVRLISMNSGGVSAPTVTRILLEQCGQVEYMTEEVTTHRIGETRPALPDGASDGYHKWVTITEEVPRLSYECSVHDMGGAVGQSRIRDWTSVGQTAIAATGYVFGQKLRRPNDSVTNVTSSQVGASSGSAAVSDASSQGGSSYSEANPSQGQSVVSSPSQNNTPIIDNDSHDTVHVTTDDAVHSDDNNVYNQ